MSSRSQFYSITRVMRLFYPWIDSEAFDRRFRMAADIEARGRSLLAQGKARGNPFFLFLNFMDAHAPYTPNPPFDDRFAGSDSELRRLFSGREGMFKLLNQLNEGLRSRRQREKLFVISQYDGGIAAEDAALGDLLRQLCELGLFENTMIVITSDHGEGFMEHGLVSHHNGSVYQTEVSIPLVIKYPGQHKAVLSDALVSQVDIMPTILETAAIVSPATLQGRSIRHFQTRESLPVFADALGVNPKWKLHGLRRAIIDGPLKLIARPNGPAELYDLVSDPGEQNDLYSANERRTAELLKQLDTWSARWPPENAKPTTLDKPALQGLKSLGYIQ
jgi:arylsulfatase A-like enzyme